MIAFDPARPDFTPYDLMCVRWRPTRMERPDHHNEIELNLLESGWVTYLLGGRKVRIEAGRLGVFWGAIPHQIIDYGDEPDYFCVTIPFSWFLQFKLPDRFVQPLLRGALLIDAGDASIEWDRAMFSQWERDLRNPREQQKAIVMLEMEARLLRLSLHLPALEQGRAEGRHPASHEAGLNKVEQMACLIARRYMEPLSIDAIASSVGLHPKYAMRLFRKTFGTTLLDYLKHHRVSHAQRLLATTGAKVVDIAHESGFHSISRFNETFRKECGLSPRAFRRQHALPA